MSVERIFYCDGPECERHVRTAETLPSAGSGIIMVSQRGGGKTLHFCGWDCILKYAAAQEPEEIIPFHD